MPDVEQTGESGLMSIALHPQFAANQLLYLSYAYKAAMVSVCVSFAIERLRAGSLNAL